MTVVYIGVDDTDVPGSPGTGRVAHGLARRLEALGLTRSLGVSRHQLLVDDRIRYTSHNSSKGIAVDTQRTIAEIAETGMEHIAECLQVGADPGLCVCAESQVTGDILTFGRLAASSVLTKDAALALAERHNVILRELGGSGDGVIGALAAVGLRAGGNDGRLVDLQGIHDVKGMISVAEIKRKTAIERVEDTAGETLGDGEIVDSLDRIRPSLLRGRPVLRVELAAADGPNRTWMPVERKHRKDSVGGVQ